MPNHQRVPRGATLPAEFYELLSANARAVVRAATEGIVRRRRLRDDAARSWALDCFDTLSVREALSDGEWGAWRQAETGMQERVAQNLMSAARLLRAHGIGPEDSAGLHPKAQSVVGKLAESTTPEEVRVVFMPRVIAGERVPLREVRDAIEALKPPKPENTDADIETGAHDPDDAPEIDAPALIVGTVEAETVEDTDWCDLPSVAMLIPIASAVPFAVTPDATVRVSAPPEPPGEAQMTAVREIARMICERLGFDGTCIANLICHGLAVPLAEEIDVLCRDLADTSMRREPDVDDSEDGPPGPDPDYDPFPHDEAEPFPSDTNNGTPNPVEDAEDTTPPAKAQTRHTFTRQGVPSLDNYGGFGPTPFGKNSKQRVH